MNIPRSLLFITGLAALPPLATAQLTWTNAGADYLFSNSANWAGNIVPNSGADLSLASSDFVGLDNGGDFLANSLTIQSGVSGAFLPAGAETLSLGSGGISNLGSGIDFQVALNVTASQTWHVGSGTFLLNNLLGIASGAVLTINVGSGAWFDFAMAGDNPDWFGAINFTGDLTGASLFANGTGFTAQKLSQITLDGVAAQLDGNRFVTGSVPTAVPEPSTYALTAGGALLCLALTRRIRARRIRTSNLPATI
ncbi:hypothetical protein CMV30_16530 [Nibricoccus aquaticus]|uniref:PEP-CTERM protein-sorting domain-containing protein n=1 Tax=Nibricoccus aquaticus TaxID=2576891 RepID=A0A290QDX8_9BACT|nr:PEP-CTERM sorting domain-containing protein [Nibricoccus aquaticus]ATC65420.1 hypothetical protein CMV30_16530 [Nibricoccus aquaticus]